MQPTATQFALIGQSYPSDAFKALHATTLLSRAARRAPRDVRMPTRWWVGVEPVVVPARLRA